MAFLLNESLIALLLLIRDNDDGHQEFELKLTFPLLPNELQSLGRRERAPQLQRGSTELRMYIRSFLPPTLICPFSELCEVRVEVFDLN